MCRNYDKIKPLVLKSHRASAILPPLISELPAKDHASKRQDPTPVKHSNALLYKRRHISERKPEPREESALAGHNEKRIMEVMRDLNWQHKFDELTDTLKQVKLKVKQSRALQRNPSHNIGHATSRSVHFDLPGI